jgi:hypothetical protein
LNEKTAKMFGRYARKVVPRDLEDVTRIERLLTKQVKAQWRLADAKGRARMRRDMKRKVAE